MLSGRRYRLKLTDDQAEMCEEFGNICRSVWNTALEQRREYRRRGEWMNYVPQAAELADAKKEHVWLKAAPSHVLQQTLRDLDAACRTQGTFKVRWRSKVRWSPSFRFPAGNLITVERVNRKWARAKLPKLGWVTFRWTRSLGGEIRSATVSRKGAHWFVSFLVDDDTTTPEHHAGTPVGIDRFEPRRSRWSWALGRRWRRSRGCGRKPGAWRSAGGSSWRLREHSAPVGSPWPRQTPAHPRDHRPPDHRLTGGGQSLVITGQAAGVHQPRERALCHPPLRQHHKPCHVVGALDDLQGQSELLALPPVRIRSSVRGPRPGAALFTQMAYLRMPAGSMASRLL